jgi:2-hydroxy-3-keto-5-methylthiopentenyl-1-phosphate phosphatase
MTSPLTTALPVMFLDFDGTISRADVVDRILVAYAGEEWLNVERQWQAGAIGSRECLRAQMALVHASRDEVDGLLDTVEVDPGFLPLLETCASRRIPVHIISDGFDYCIRRILERCGPDVTRLLKTTRICASHLEPQRDGQWSVDFPFSARLCEHGCATCKPWVMRLLNPERAVSLFVGDGLSDRYAARAADVVFAKTGLAAFCAAEDVQYRSYDTLADVALNLNELLQAASVAARHDLTSTRKAWTP